MDVDGSLSTARILIVDDEPANVLLLERILGRAGYEDVVTTTDPRKALSLFDEREPDLVLLDLMMPELDGFGVMQELSRRIPEGVLLPILVLTADATKEARERALSMGARDFLTKPLDHTEVLLRIRNLLEARLIYLRLHRQNEWLEAKVREQTAELRDSLGRVQAVAEHRRQMLLELAEAQEIVAANKRASAK
jgi:putative two-component system response regulator